jgi:hypothetical protein
MAQTSPPTTLYMNITNAVGGLNWRTWIMIVLAVLLSVSVALNIVEMSRDTVNRKVIDARKQDIINLQSANASLDGTNKRIQVEKDSVAVQIDSLNKKIDQYEKQKTIRDNHVQKVASDVKRLPSHQSLGNFMQWTSGN